MEILKTLFKGRLSYGVGWLGLALGVVAWINPALLSPLGIHVDPVEMIQLALATLGIRRAIG